VDAARPAPSSSPFEGAPVSPSVFVTVSIPLDLALAAFFLLRWARQPRCRLHCAGHGLMALSMAVMASPWGSSVPPAAGVGVFSAAALWSGRLLASRRGRGGHAAVQVCVGSAVMAAMYLRHLTAGSGTTAVAHHHAIGSASATPTVAVVVALACAGVLAYQVGRSVTLLAVGSGGVPASIPAPVPGPELVGGALMGSAMVAMLLTGLA
jgi:Domain of unknown function (DUF5134)